MKGDIAAGGTSAGQVGSGEPFRSAADGRSRLESSSHMLHEVQGPSTTSHQV